MLDKFDFQWETHQREKMEALVNEVNRLRKLKTKEPTPSGPKTDLERLEFENSELKLLVAVIIRILEAKGLSTPTDFLEMTESVAAELRAK